MPGGYEVRLHRRWLADRLPGEPKHRFIRRLAEAGDEDARRALSRRRRRRGTERSAPTERRAA